VSGPVAECRSLVMTNPGICHLLLTFGKVDGNVLLTVFFAFTLKR
jgi:hypothetical protein